MPAPISREIRERVLTLRQEKVPNAEIADQLNISISTICKFVKNGIERKGRKRGYRNKSRRTNKFNDDFFAEINADEKAYWLGMFFSDGSVWKDKSCHSYRSVLSLDSRDVLHLDKFLTAIDFDRSLGRIFISNRKDFDTKMARVQLLSEKMFSDLVSLGCVPSKSRILMPPKIEEEFDKSFLRGFFDGDGGSTFMVNERLFGCTVSFVGTKPVLDYISNIIYNELGMKGSFVKVQDWTYRLIYGSPPQIFKLFDWLYDDFDKT